MAMAWQSPLGYGRLALGSWIWLCLAWRRLGLAINPLGLGYGGRLIWLLMAMGRPLDLAINGYGLVPLGYGGFGLALLG